MKKIFKVAQIKELLEQVQDGKISFSRFVEILNESVDNHRNIIEPLDNSLEWIKWLELSDSHGLNVESQSNAIRDIYKKINEVVGILNSL